MRNAVLVLLVIVLSGCSADVSGPRGQRVAAASDGSGVARRSITIAMSREPASLEPSLQSQNAEWAALCSGFLAYFSAADQHAVPYLAEELPSFDRGTWRINADGQMETTYRLRADAVWQDGEPITASDFVFGWIVRIDPTFPGYSVDVERRLSQVLALDSHTLLLQWSEPYLWAGMVHLPDFPPMASHKLRTLYNDDRAAFMDGPHWREEFVGSGPFKVSSWEPGVEIVFAANDRFVLGKPGVDEIRMRFISDANTIVANLLSGSVDSSFSIALGFEQGQALEQAGWSGRVDYWKGSGSPRFIEFQARDWGNTQKAVFDPSVRRAAHYAIDRRAIVDSIYAGRAEVAYFWLSPLDPAFGAVDRATPKYAYDPIRAQALLMDAGWVRGTDGIVRSAATGQPLAISILNTPTEADAMEAASVANDWKAVGIGSDIQRLSPQEIRDNELRSKFPGVTYNRRSLTLDSMNWTAANVSRPEARWSGPNRSGYVNPQLDVLWSKVLGSVDQNEREQWLIAATSLMLDDAVVVLTHITPNVMAYNAAIVGPTEPAVVDTSRIWNIWEWRWK